MRTTKIQWTETTWNPMAGCSRYSPGCLNCYAEREAIRLTNNPNPKIAAKYEGLATIRNGRPGWTGRVNFDAPTLAKAFSWKKPGFVFVDSMSDAFHEKLSNEQIAALFGVMAAVPHMTFQVLTKRAPRLVEWHLWLEEEHEDPRAACVDYAIAALRDGGEDPPKALTHTARRGPWPLPNVWQGVSTENAESLGDRAPLLLMAPAAVRWLSVEPLLDEVDVGRWLDLGPGPRIDWVVVGGESGSGARPCDIAWIRRVVKDCQTAGVPCFVKQLGARPFDGLRDAPGPPRAYENNWVPIRHRKGGEPKEWPENLRVREWPAQTPGASAKVAITCQTTGPAPAADPHENLRAAGRRCAAMLGRERAVGWWRQARLPLATATATEVLQAADALLAFEAKGREFVKLEAYGKVLRLRGQDPAEEPAFWPQMELRTLAVRTEVFRRRVVESAPEDCWGPGRPPSLFTPAEVKALVEERNAGDVGDGQVEVRVRPGLPLDEDDIMQAYAGAYGAILLATRTDDEGLQVYHLKVNRD